MDPADARLLLEATAARARPPVCPGPLRTGGPRAPIGAELRAFLASSWTRFGQLGSRAIELAKQWQVRGGRGDEAGGKEGFDPISVLPLSLLLLVVLFALWGSC